MTSAKSSLNELMSDVRMKSSGDKVDGVELSSLTASSSSVTFMNFDNESPLNNGEGLMIVCRLVRVVEMAVLIHFLIH